MPFQNFSIWRGKLPHWRADNVHYYVTFRHRRELDEAERRVLLKYLIRPEGKRWDLLILCVLPDRTELIFDVRPDRTGRPYELSDVVEQAKRKAGNVIIKNTGERYPPFYGESFDRIIRDDVELEERWNEILESPVKAELVEDSEEHEALWVPHALEP
jgi:hypothetical protein